MRINLALSLLEQDTRVQELRMIIYFVMNLEITSNSSSVGDDLNHDWF
jgi:hypothetical protein